MNIEIINIGDELLIGQVINTNASFMAQELNKVGFNVYRITTIADDALEIETSVKKALENADSVIITGGLGPTKDDITKYTLAKIFDSQMIESKEVLANIKTIFDRRGFELTPTNRLQALVPEKCRVIENLVGTAAGMCFEKDNKLTFSMPGVPFEMKEMLIKHVIPILQSHYKPDAIFHRTIITQGVGESFLSDMIEEFELALPKYIKLAYLPSANMLRLRLSARGENEKEVKAELDRQIDKLMPLIKDCFLGFNEGDLSHVLADMLIKEGKTVSLAESCTGGNIARKITINAGSSQYFKGSVVAYSNDVKVNVLGVDEKAILDYGAVSEEVAKQMAIGAIKIMNSDYAISTTGVAGPDGGTDEKPVGTVWVAVANKKGECIASQHNFYSSRENFIDRTTNEGFSKLIRFIKQKN
ncbi:MAG: competence/damage-inducible protein A [Bacteroidales bacterium]|nr:competence/damage-inducible protein A [Bacteroidales bacterium]